MSRLEQSEIQLEQTEFIPMIRMYGPQQKAPSIIDGSWKIPPVKQAS